MGARADLEIFSRLASAMGTPLAPSQAEEVFAEIRQLVPGYDVSLVNVLAGGAEMVVPLDGFPPPSIEQDGRIHSAQDTLFTSGTLGRYSPCLQMVPERNTRERPGPA